MNNNLLFSLVIATKTLKLKMIENKSCMLNIFVDNIFRKEKKKHLSSWPGLELI